MSNLQKFNTTIEDFDKEVVKLKAAASAYQKLQTLTDEYEEISKQLDQNSEALSQIVEQLEAQQQNVNKSLVEIETNNKKHRTEISDLVIEKTDLIRKDNKEFYKELESTIKIKLDDNKSQIKQLIESERARIKDIFELEFAKNTKELRQVIEDEINEQTQLILANQNVIKLSVWVLSGLASILGALTIYKLWN
jgi:ABC-type transporter Mla subunit MlaD